MTRLAKVSVIAAAAVVLSGAAAAFAIQAHAQPIRYEAEAPPATCDGTIDSNHAGFSGSGFCNADNTVGAAAQFTVNAPNAGTATLTIRYANGTSQNRAADMSVNGSLIQAGFPFEGTGGWTSWVTKTLTVPVAAGGNTIRLSPTTAGGLGNVDYLEVEVDTGPTQSRYEAEDPPATCAGSTDSNHGGFSGSGFCNADNAVGAAVQFTVDATGPGTATIGVRFANGSTSTRPADVLVNGGAVQSTSFESTGAWATWATRTLTVQVSAGSNTIRLSPITANGLPNVDFLDVQLGGSTSPPPSDALFVATNGNDSNPGTLSEPLRTIQRAVDLAQAGDTIFLRGGTYAPSSNIQLLKSGTPSQPITIRNHNGERAIIDGENMPHTPAPVGGSIPRPERGAIHIEGEHWHLIGLEIINGPYGIFGLDTSHNVFDRLITRDNYESGLHLQGASSDNQVINLDSFGNRDPRKNGESADGLAIKEGSGTGNVVRGARLWNNSDDGFDAWEFLSPILIEDSLAWGNGFNRWNLPGFTGDGNGFKLGGGGDEDPPAAHSTRNSMAWDNAVGGFIDNANPGTLLADRCTAWRNGGTGFDFADADGTLTRNLAVANDPDVSLGSSSSSGNSWDIGGTWTFVSTDPGTITGPRQADGSIPPSSFLRPSNGADVGARF